MGHKITGGRPVSDSLKEYARGVAGGLIFSFPLLYTMEVWWAGFIAGPLQLIVLIFVTFLLLLGYNRFAGMHPDVSWRSIVIDSVEEMGIGLVISFAVLLMLNRIQLQGMGLDEIMGKVVIEAMAVSIGVSVGTAQLGAESNENNNHSNSGKNGSDDKSGKEKKEEKRRNSRIGILVMTLCGAVLVGGNVAPTEEIILIAFEATAPQILIMVIVSLCISVIVVFFSDFKGTTKEVPGNLVYNITFEACFSYLIALAASAFILWFFGRFENHAFRDAFALCIVLGVITTLGASAGRLLIK